MAAGAGTEACWKLAMPLESSVQEGGTHIYSESGAQGKSLSQGQVKSTYIEGSSLLGVLNRKCPAMNSAPTVFIKILFT